MRYRPAPCPVPVHVFQASGAGEEHQARLAAAIRELCAGPCIITPVPGTHWGLLGAEHVTDMAIELDAALERAGAERGVHLGS
jgi:hypothetical protein